MTIDDGAQPDTRTGRETDPILTDFLADRDEPCPACGYNLRGGTSAVCPECGAQIKLGVQWANVLYAWWMLTLIGIILPLAAPVGLAVFCVIIMCFDRVDKIQVGIVVWDLCMAIIPTIVLVMLLRRRIRFLKMSPNRQRLHAILYLICGVAYLGIGWTFLISAIINL